MPIDPVTSDLSRAIQHEPDTSWPTEVKVQLVWMVDRRACVRTLHVDGDHFFGRGGFGAPMEGIALMGSIENMRRMGPPQVERPAAKRKAHAKKKR